MKRIIILVVGFMLIGATLFAGSGDLIVNGNLGVGTTSPAYKLTIKESTGTAEQLAILGTNGNAFTIGATGDNFYIQDKRANATRLFLLYNGNVGIGTTSPGYKLSIQESSGTGEQLALVGTNGNAAFTIGATGDNFYIQDKLANATRLFLQYNGNVGIGTTSPSEKLHVAGNIYATGTITPSDAKFKTNINPIGSALNTVTKLHGVSYNWKTEEFKNKGFSEGKHYGLIAQDIEKVLPDVVRTDPNGDKAVAYNELIPILIEAIKEQQKEIDTLKVKQVSMEQQQALVSALYEKVNAMEKQMKLQGTVARVDY